MSLVEFHGSSVVRMNFKHQSVDLVQSASGLCVNQREQAKPVTLVFVSNENSIHGNRISLVQTTQHIEACKFSLLPGLNFDPNQTVLLRARDQFFQCIYLKRKRIKMFYIVRGRRFQQCTQSRGVTDLQRSKRDG